MPTGYTYPVVEGKITKFPDFALSCARAFSALITLRDAPMDAPIPTKIEPSPYHAKKLSEVKANLAKVMKMTPRQMENAAAKSNRASVEAVESIRRDYEMQNARLQGMLDKANAWKPPTPDHKGMKDFMIQQLEDSMASFDYMAPAEELSGKEWHKREVERLKRDVAYHTKENAAEVSRARVRTEWIKKLRASLRASAVTSKEG